MCGCTPEERQCCILKEIKDAVSLGVRGPDWQVLSVSPPRGLCVRIVRNLVGEQQTEENFSLGQSRRVVYDDAFL